MTTDYVGYIRVSTKGQEASGLGLEAQQSMIRRHVEFSGGRLLGEYREAESGKRTDRPELAAAMERCRAEGACLLIGKLDRLARDVHFISGLMKSGVKFRACDMPDADPFMLHVQAAFAEEEARRISSRTRAALSARRSRGLPMGAAAHKSGWTPAKAQATRTAGRKGARVVQEKTRAFYGSVGKRIAELKANGRGNRAIAMTLNQEGFRTPLGNLWTVTQVKRAFKYLGMETGGKVIRKIGEENKGDARPLIARLREEGLSMGQIAGRLNTEGIPSPFPARMNVGGRGPWGRKGVAVVLREMGLPTSSPIRLTTTEMDKIQSETEKLAGRRTGK